MLSLRKITEIFCSIDDFCHDFWPVYQKGLLSSKKRIRPSKLHLSEIMTIQVRSPRSNNLIKNWIYVCEIRIHPI